MPASSQPSGSDSAADGASASSALALFQPKVQPADLMMFSRQLHTLLRAGVPILRALAGLQDRYSAGELAPLSWAQCLLRLASRAAPAKPIDVSIAYLRSGKPVDVFARAEISRAGRRIAHVQAEAWQESRSRPIASLTAHFLLEDS